MTSSSLLSALLLSALWLAPEAEAFCGFYVAKADADLYNEASQVVLARNGDQTVITMVNDYEGDPSEFAMVIPVPNVIGPGAVKVIDPELVKAVDAFSAPRLVQYYDPDPCYQPLNDAVRYKMPGGKGLPLPAPTKSVAAPADYGVTIEARYTVEEYDVLVLSAQESNGLEKWLKLQGYRIPDGASSVLGSYIAQNMRFFVAAVNLQNQERSGRTNLRPLQVRYESPKFMLPIRLGTVNAKGTQELLVYAITPKARIEATNYRTVKLPTDLEIPTFVVDDFGSFHKSLFDKAVKAESGRAVFVEYAWPLSILCDPCSTDPLTQTQLTLLGADWVTPTGGGKLFNAAFLTRLHLRYDAAHFPEDLRFQETADTKPYQGRYVMNHPWEGGLTCAAVEYKGKVDNRRQQEVENLATITSWTSEEIWKRMEPVPWARGSGQIKPIIAGEDPVYGLRFDP